MCTRVCVCAYMCVRVCANMCVLCARASVCRQKGLPCVWTLVGSARWQVPLPLQHKPLSLALLVARGRDAKPGEVVSSSIPVFIFRSSTNVNETPTAPLSRMDRERGSPPYPKPQEGDS